MNQTAVPAIMGLAIRWGHKRANRNHTSMGRGLLAGGTDAWGPQMRPGSSGGGAGFPAADGYVCTVPCGTVLGLESAPCVDRGEAVNQEQSPGLLEAVPRILS